MADIDLKTLTPDTSLPTTGFLFGADSQASASPSVYSTQTVATTLLGSTSLTGATITTSQPVLDLSQTWNASGVTFTGLRFNAAGSSDANSAAASLLMDLQVGGSSRFSVRKDGTITAPALAFTSSVGTYPNVTIASSGGNWGLHLASTAVVDWARTADFTDTKDLFLTRRAAANLRLGAADAGATTATVTITIAAPGVVTWTGHGFSTGTPVVFTTTGALPTGITAGTTYYAVVVDANTFQIASSVANAIAATPTVITTSGTQSGTHTGTRYNITQRLSMQGVTGVTDRLGADLIIQGSQGTGTGAGGSIIFQVAPAGSTGSAQNALATALTIGGDRRLSFPDGTFIINDAPTGASNQIGIWAGGVFGLNRGGGNASQIILYANGVSGLVLNGGTSYGAAPYLSFASPTAGTQDTFITRDAANTLALRNGANAQNFNVYNTHTSSTNYEAINIGWDSNNAYIGAAIGSGGGTRRPLRLFGSEVDFLIGTTTVSRIWLMNSSGHFLAGADNTYDIGASSSGRPRAIYAGTSIEVNGYFQAADTGSFFFQNRSVIKSAANGDLTISNRNQTDFGRLNFGGTTSSFPAIKRSSTALETKLADDSAYAPHAMQYLDVTDGITAPASATGRARIYVDTADGDLKVIFADGTVKTIVTDT